MPWKVATFYRFVTLDDCAALRDQLRPVFTELGLCGSLLLAPEGINGTLAGGATAIDQMLALLATHCALPKEDVKFSAAPQKPFQRLKIRVKKEIITFKQPQANPAQQVGVYVAAKDWNDLLTDPEVVLLDTRNRYETMIGSFKGATDPQIDTFTAFADYVRSHLDPKRHKKIAMYCTGGIRCEKASSFMLAAGFQEVYHLKGGILKYLEEVPVSESLWQGDCYVFDRRVGVGHSLSTGQLSMCFTCGLPLKAENRSHPLYEAGVSCPHCHDQYSESDKRRFRQRQQQLSPLASCGQNVSRRDPAPLDPG